MTVLILGGYGVFGRRIATALAKKNIAIIIAGRNLKAAKNLVVQIKQKCPAASLDIAVFDIEKELSSQLKRLDPAVVINTCGPFQMKDYAAAKCCIEQQIHYIDLADGRNFVNGITTLDKSAKDAGVAVISGASTVPGLSSAVLEHYKNTFKSIDTLIYGITPGQQAPRGLATSQSVLSYLGKPLKPVVGDNKPRYGWQNLYRQTYPELGQRWMANCDIPDLDLLPKYYDIKHISFSAGMENSLLHLGIWCLSWLVRLGMPLHLSKYAKFFLKASHCFDRLGTANGGMHLLVSGTDKNNQAKTIKWFIVAKEGDGPQIPTIPAIILAKKLMAGQLKITGAMPCIGLVSLDEYMAELQGFNVKVYEE